jgi:hypothetical protein
MFDPSRIFGVADTPPRKLRLAECITARAAFGIRSIDSALTNMYAIRSNFPLIARISRR